jgi:ATP-dependent DNA helicase RecQ
MSPVDPSSPSAAAVAAETAARIAARLREFWGFDSLRPLQQQAISAALDHRDSLLIMPTGGGKSLCYQLPPLVDDAVDVVVSPLIALMKDQVDGLQQSGVPAIALHSGLSPEQRRANWEMIKSRAVRLIFTAPERLLTADFLDMLADLQVQRFAIDEAHCISQWGHDFRPEYRQLTTLRQRFPQASFHAFTATAAPRVREDILAQLQLREPLVLVGPVDRPNLVYRVLPKVDVERQAATVLKRHVGDAAIVYCISRRETESLATWLTQHGITAGAYHAGMTPEQRHRIQDDFASEKLNVVVATVAFGMGIDRSNVRCVIHTGIPKSLEHYQQETGRAGRDGLEAECVLFYSAGDAIRWEQLIARSAADAPEPEAVIQASTHLLQQMMRFSNSASCRHRALTEYFGQQYAQFNCGACDVCLDEIDALPDSTLIAQKILSCVARVQQRFGVGHVVDVLLGGDTENVRKFGHQKLSTYGLLKDMERKPLMSLVYQLVDQALLTRSQDEFPRLGLNAASLEVMRGQRQVKLLKPPGTVKQTRTKAAVDRSKMDTALFEDLRAWRRELAAKRGVPPFIILYDSTLVALATEKPTRPSDLASIPGLGAKKRADFGEALCARIARHLRP